MPCSSKKLYCSTTSNECVTFYKKSDQDATLAENQDRISKTVWLTRLSADLITSGNGILFNAASETVGTIDNTISPKDTLWAFGSWKNIRCHLDDVDFVVFRNLKEYIAEGLDDLAGKTVVLYLQNEKKYYQVKFLTWGQGGDGLASFGYKRSKCPLKVPKKFKKFVPTETVPYHDY